MSRKECRGRAVAVKAAADNQAEIAVLANPGVHLWVAVGQGTLYHDGRVEAERRLRLGRSLYQRAESLKSLSLLRASGWTRPDGVGFWSALSSPPCSAGWARAVPSALARAI
jgi:hypothetical protein